ISIENFKPINILSAGSYSCKIPTEIAGYVGNTFHIIETDSYSKEVLKGRVKSSAYDTVKGWVQSSERNGIEFDNPFGNNQSILSLTKIGSEIIKDIIDHERFAKFSALYDKIEDLEYLPYNTKKKLIERIQSEI